MRILQTQRWRKNDSLENGEKRKRAYEENRGNQTGNRYNKF